MCAHIVNPGNVCDFLMVQMSPRYFLVYCLYKGNKPQVNPEIMLPGFISGHLYMMVHFRKGKSLVCFAEKDATCLKLNILIYSYTYTYPISRTAMEE